MGRFRREIAVMPGADGAREVRLPAARERIDWAALPAVFRTFLKTKLHRATITAADPHYEGSISIDRAFCRAAGLLEYEQVDVLDIDNGARFTTYVIYGEPGQVQVNGAAARLVRPGDLVIVLAYCRLAPEQVEKHRSRVVLMGPGNTLVSVEDKAISEP